MKNNKDLMVISDYMSLLSFILLLALFVFGWFIPENDNSGIANALILFGNILWIGPLLIKNKEDYGPMQGFSIISSIFWISAVIG